MTQIDRNHVWDMIEDMRVCMLVTWDGSRQSARPMGPMPIRDENAIYFFTDVKAEKDDQIREFPIVTLAYVDTSNNDYVSLTGTATLTNDRRKIEQLWSPVMKTWWEDAHDENIRLIKVVPEDAQAWDGPGGLVASVKMAAAAAGMGEVDLGESAKVKM
ncbi:pyridoxamine 5'-phosphate oxidase family protein [Hoeflea olei]|uniref:General stress protein FMN-binding split barrel domain-containing protein n=1 Tax=Hoeflea olei TaxID=1480615 RepID=A0A1C1YQL6_9HYPH|nr:pyridoxamine 5'-phosphate oxidase family protein [Hoeflea olei]OCW55805.1 hypothetical protein AWJ14_15100 [Hoeflea olei]